MRRRAPPPASGHLDHAARYEELVGRSIAFSGLDHEFFIQAKADHLVDLARRRLGGPERLSVLDLGCGVGLLARKLVSAFGRVHGADASRDAVRAARGLGGGVSYTACAGARLPFPDDSFDLVLAACVLHHVPRAERGALVRELVRVARPAGGVAVFEHNPFHPLTRLAVSRCDFDRDAHLVSLGKTCALFAGAAARILERRYILHFPWRGRLAGRLERLLGRAPLGAQYLVFASKGGAP
jgi:SAM-dependent methyltransferase